MAETQLPPSLVFLVRCLPVSLINSLCAPGSRTGSTAFQPPSCFINASDKLTEFFIRWKNLNWFIQIFTEKLPLMANHKMQSHIAIFILPIGRLCHCFLTRLNPLMNAPISHPGWSHSIQLCSPVPTYSDRARYPDTPADQGKARLSCCAFLYWDHEKPRGGMTAGGERWDQTNRSSWYFKSYLTEFNRTS